MHPAVCQHWATPGQQAFLDRLRVLFPLGAIKGSRCRVCEYLATPDGLEFHKAQTCPDLERGLAAWVAKGKN